MMGSPAWRDVVLRCISAALLQLRSKAQDAKALATAIISANSENGKQAAEELEVLSDSSLEVFPLLSFWSCIGALAVVGGEFYPLSVGAPVVSDSGRRGVIVALIGQRATVLTSDLHVSHQANTDRDLLLRNQPLARFQPQPSEFRPAQAIWEDASRNLSADLLQAAGSVLLAVRELDDVAVAKRKQDEVEKFPVSSSYLILHLLRVMSTRIFGSMFKTPNGIQRLYAQPKVLNELALLAEQPSLPTAVASQEHLLLKQVS